MPLSWNEIKDRALKFSHEWANESSEDAEAKSFWDAFFTVFGVPRRRVATFEQPVKKSDGHGGFIDLLWRGILLVEHKSRGRDLVSQFNILCDVDQFFGIEIEEFPAQIAQTALWLMDHQMNMRVSEEFGNYFVRLPLRKSATIVHGNALQRDWREIVKPKELTYILGNPRSGGSNTRATSRKRTWPAFSMMFRARVCWILSSRGTARRLNSWRATKPSRLPLCPPIQLCRANR